MRAFVFTRSLTASLSGRRCSNRGSRVKSRAQNSSVNPAKTSLSFGGPKAFFSSALVSAAFCGAGDLLSQYLVHYLDSEKHMKVDGIRILRMLSYGLFFYGPFQHVWYRSLAYFFPNPTLTHFLPKLVLNQVVLGPIAVSAVFTWVMVSSQKASYLKSKFQRDFMPTLISGWKFWIPAAAANFTIIPLRSQVAFMSLCSFCWAAFLGYQSNKPLLQE